MPGYFKQGAWVEIPFPKIPTDMDILRARVAELERAVCACTTTHIDVHMKTPSQVIVIGRFKNHDHIRAYTVPNEALPNIIEEMQHFEKLSRIGRIDAPMDFRACYRIDEY